jgi:hypothetical protein
MTKQQNPWTPEDLAKLNTLVEIQRLPWPETGSELNRTAAACKVQYFYQKRLRARGNRSEPARTAYHTKRIETNIKADEAKEAWLARPEPTITEKICGDPAPGRSALDKKRAGIVDPEYFDRRDLNNYRPSVTLAAGPPLR